MADAVLTGIFAVKFPVTDLPRSRTWYADVFGVEWEYEFPDDDGVVRGVAGPVPGLDGVGIALRENPAVARGIAGFDPVIFAVADRAAVEAWAHHLDGLGIAHSPVIEATIGYLLAFHDPDGTEIHLYSTQQHGIDQTGRSGHGRRIAQ